MLVLTKINKMNLAAYDCIKKIDYSKTWVDPRFKKLYSMEIPYYNFYSFLTRYNNNLKMNEYYIVMHNDINSELKIYPTVSRRDVVKISLKDIWNKVFIRAPESITNVTLEVDDIQEDCIIYFINALNI